MPGAGYGIKTPVAIVFVQANFVVGEGRLTKG